PVKFAETLQQQSLRETAAAACGTNSDRSDPATAGSLRVVPGGRDDTLVGANEEPERRIVIRLRDLSFPPLLEGRRFELPVLGKGLLERSVERTCTFRGKRLDPKTLGELRLGRRIIAELDRHLPETAHLAVAATGQQRIRRHVRRKSHRVDSPDAERPKPLLTAADELPPETTSSPVPMDDADTAASVIVLLRPPRAAAP